MIEFPRFRSNNNNNKNQRSSPYPTARQTPPRVSHIAYNNNILRRLWIETLKSSAFVSRRLCLVQDTTALILIQDDKALNQLLSICLVNYILICYINIDILFAFR